MSKWVIHAKKADFKRISGKFGIDQVTARILRNRDIVGDDAIYEYLSADISQMHPPELMQDLKQACEYLKSAIGSGRKIRVIGDYDIDGVMSTYILCSALGKLGADVDFDIPDRLADGYGLSKRLVDMAKGRDIILTCDNGIAAREEIQYAVDKGMTVIVTDHHEVPYEEVLGERRMVLPPAKYVVDPKRYDCKYPFKELCGASVAYKLVEYLFGLFGKEPGELTEFLQYAAFATIGDVVDLKGENRIIVKEGLPILRKTQNHGLSKLMESCMIQRENLSVYHIGFVLGPCLNAGGRLDSAKRSLKLLSCKSKREAAIYAGDLKSLNDSRKEMTEQAVNEAFALAESDFNHRVLVLYLPNCHESIAGIVAGRVREKYYRPVFIITGKDEIVKGSGRSIEPYSMFEEMSSCKELFVKYGGHKMAAGLSIRKENIDTLKKRLNENCTLSSDDLEEKIYIDCAMPMSYVKYHENIIDEISDLEPFGKANPRPIFAEKDLKVVSLRIFGKNENVAKLILEDGHGNLMDAVYFGDARAMQSYVSGKDYLAVIYYPQYNEYMGTKSIQFIIKDYR